jgi:transposase
MDSLVSHGYHIGLVDANYLSHCIQQDRISKERGQHISYDGYYMKANGRKLYAAVVTSILLLIAIYLGPGNEYESRRLFSLLRNIRIKGTRRPWSKPKQVYADNKYHIPSVMMYLASRGIIAVCIKERVNRKKTPGRRRLFDYYTYSKIRSSVERFFGWMKSFRRIQTRHDRLTSTYLGFLQLGCVMILMRNVSR